MSAIVARAPLRVSLGGGGSDLPAYYREHGGFVVSTAIDRYVHITVSGELRERYVLKHLEAEEVDDPADIRHPILRAVLTRRWSGGPVELASVGDVPPGTGLGSSGAYTVCLLGALAAAEGGNASAAELAEAASEIEIGVLGRTVGKQDQYAAAFGGLRAYTFRPDEGVDVRELDLRDETRRALREEFLLFYAGGEGRSAADVLSGALSGGERVRRALDRIAGLARETCAVLESGELERWRELMDEQWEAKRERAPGTVTPAIDDLRDVAMRAEADGVTLLGAGGGGFLLVYARDPARMRRAMEDAGAPELRFDIEPRGCVAEQP